MKKIYVVSDRCYPAIKSTVRFKGTKEDAKRYVEENYKDIKMYYDFCSKQYCKGDGAYYANFKGLEVVILPEEYEDDK